MKRWIMQRSGYPQFLAVLAIFAVRGFAHADTSPQELLALVPANAAGVVLIPNLKFCSDEITRWLDGMDRANLLLGMRPLDQLKSFTGYNVGINDIGGAAAIAMPTVGGPPLNWAYLIPVSDGSSFLAGNFKSHGKGDEYLDSDGRTWTSRLIGTYAIVSQSAEAVAAVTDSVQSKPGVQSPWQDLGTHAADLMGDGEIIIAVSKSGARRLADRAATFSLVAGDELLAKRLVAAFSPMNDQLRIGIMVINFDPLGVITRTLSIFDPGSAIAQHLTGGKGSESVPLNRLPRKPAYIAVSIDVQGLGGAESMGRLWERLQLSAPPAWLTQSGGFQFAAYPSPAALAGGLLNDAVAIMQTSTPQQARDALRAGLLAIKDHFKGVQSEVVWLDDKPVKNAASPMSADHYEVKILDVAPEQAMVQTVSPLIFGRGGWRGFVKSTDDEVLMTFSQRPAVLEGALNVKPDSSYGASGVIKTMHTWIPPHSDIEVYIGVAQLAEMARQIAGSFGVNAIEGMPEFEANTPPIGFAADVDQGTISSTTVIPAAVLSPLVDRWIGMMKNGGGRDGEPASTPMPPGSGEKP